ncbi:cytochrome b/b6 domain-containing protein [Candidatus Electronema sp. PJ]|uniref:cytochrome b/b6 domain-containing protein n=1 Tax=Candidatus Electronema sp. PJ TaxID=3401572 RepID=UPI003AA93BD3
MNTENTVIPGATAPLGNPVRFWHLAMIALVLMAVLTGDRADDYKQIEHAGFLLHGTIGVTVFVALCFYFLYSFLGPQGSRLTTWFPLTLNRLKQTGKDLAVLSRFKLPEHKRRQGLAGLVEFFGLMAFSWLAVTGTLMFFFMERGVKAQGIMHAVKEAHEIGTVLIPVYLVIHVGAVIAHSVTGHQVWKEMFFLEKN